jgi:hypothetical protein
MGIYPENSLARQLSFESAVRLQDFGFDPLRARLRHLAQTDIAGPADIVGAKRSWRVYGPGSVFEPEQTPLLNRHPPARRSGVLHNRDGSGQLAMPIGISPSAVEGSI